MRVREVLSIIRVCVKKSFSGDRDWGMGSEEWGDGRIK
jgi:hypothetical protein